MKITPLFNSVFAEELKKQGFKKKGRCFYRLVGEILQGITVKPINPYDIHFIAKPYWIPMRVTNLESWASLVKGYWIEDSYGLLSSSDMVRYYREAEAGKNLDIMNSCLHAVKTYFIPILDRVVDLDSYLDMVDVNWPNLPEPWSRERIIDIKYEDIAEKYVDLVAAREMTPSLRLFYPTLSYMEQYAYLYKAYEDGTFERAYISLNESLDNESKRYRINRSYYTSVFDKVMNANDLEWIVRFKEERTRIIRPRLRDELGLDVSHLPTYD